MKLRFERRYLIIIVYQTFAQKMFTDYVGKNGKKFRVYLGNGYFVVKLGFYHLFQPKNGRMVDRPKNCVRLHSN